MRPLVFIALFCISCSDDRVRYVQAPDTFRHWPPIQPREEPVTIEQEEDDNRYIMRGGVVPNITGNMIGWDSYDNGVKYMNAYCKGWAVHHSGDDPDTVGFAYLFDGADHSNNNMNHLLNNDTWIIPPDGQSADDAVRFCQFLKTPSGHSIFNSGDIPPLLTTYFWIGHLYNQFGRISTQQTSVDSCLNFSSSEETFKGLTIGASGFFIQSNNYKNVACNKTGDVLCLREIDKSKRKPAGQPSNLCKSETTD